MAAKSGGEPRVQGSYLFSNHFNIRCEERLLMNERRRNLGNGTTAQVGVHTQENWRDLQRLSAALIERQIT